MERILAYNSRTRFFPDMYLVQICLAYPIIYTIQFFKTQLCHFKYIWQNILMQKIKKTHWADPVKNVSQIDG